MPRRDPLQSAHRGRFKTTTAIALLRPNLVKEELEDWTPDAQERWNEMRRIRILVTIGIVVLLVTLAVKG